MLTLIKLKQKLEFHEKDAFRNKFMLNPQNYIYDDDEDIDIETLTPAQLEGKYQEWNDSQKRYIKYKIDRMEEFELLLYPDRELPAPEPIIANIWR